MSEPHKIRIYLAGPLFTQAEWQWNERLTQELRGRSLDVILPQSGAEPMLLGVKTFDAQSLFQTNIDSIQSADVVVAILDGADVDSGTAWECGYAFRAAKPVVGVRTDIRAGGDDPKSATNLMLSMSCQFVVAIPPANRTDLALVAQYVAEAVRQVKGLRTTPG